MTWTRQDLEATKWAKSFKKEAPVSYEKGLRYALQEELEVFLSHNNDTGEWQWCIVVEDNSGFWMDALESKPAAIKLCQEMGWKLTGVFDHKSNTMLPIITEQEKPYTYTDGDKVEFNNDTLSGSGIVRGVALTVTSIHGVHYIIEIVECEKAFPNDDYPFHFITVLDEHLKAA